MATTTAAAPPRKWMQVPRPLQKLFDTFPLVAYDVNALPARAQSATSGNLPTLYVFSTEEDALLGAPSFNPSCLKWQAFLKLAGVKFQILPSTNHASPTGALPFILPKRSAPTDAPSPIPSSKLYDYALKYGTSNPPDVSALRLDAYQALLDVPIRNAWLQALYRDPECTDLLDRFYITTASSSFWVRGALRHQLRRAAEAEILKTGPGGAASTALSLLVDEDAVYRAAVNAFEALATLLSESKTGWFFGAQTPTIFDASVFAYTHLMLQYMSDAKGEGEDDGGSIFRSRRLGNMVRRAGSAELEQHHDRLFELLWPADSSANLFNDKA
ncbi:hypothetical protein SMACR_08376 [Sordaria macrospora]|uniref:WGS project CABT00000000 data, contig 2.28 n=2 Tax=Sordaria macrospora TaxID=5147 RepID=F7W4T1_SORMK|nr:uncharacterized protein SMAC_08376 [Sordaria macrospora k-hell]KAA8631393.1 hypothetical protein SMACR_08376 [Sordaria macrospora]KAH7633429.1 hypothetical protein B0T09DRAFT_380889 [Sordaria sp. MPI-SDFR-AT-0083]WPJ60168.1 hypothetical protein SMAC4_08376 [Sordaria macrospora]CCC12518.1 unnamed protein product [Sordaria macrospora k-hell]